MDSAASMKTAGSATLHDEDILVWSEIQAAALRALAGRRDLPNELDLANVVEEVEDVGKSEFRGVKSLISNIFVQLILLWADPDAPALRGWQGEVTAWHVDLLDRVSPSMRARLVPEILWRSAARVACAKLSAWDADKAVRAKGVLTGLSCPFDIAALWVEEFDIVEAVAKLPPG